MYGVFEVRESAEFRPKYFEVQAIQPSTPHGVFVASYRQTGSFGRLLLYGF